MRFRVTEQRDHESVAGRESRWNHDIDLNKSGRSDARKRDLRHLALDQYRRWKRKRERRAVDLTVRNCRIRSSETGSVK